jgi:hypothetical protein
MRVVDTAAQFPGVCCLSGTSSGPFVQLDRPLGPEVAHGGVAYISLREAQAIARAIGYVPGPLVEEADEHVQRLIAERDEARDQHHELLAAVGTTLKHGAVVRNGQVELRKPYDRRPKRRRS